jgi:hypothetical protein
MSKHPLLRYGDEIPPQIGMAAKSAKKYNELKKIGTLKKNEEGYVDGTETITLKTHKDGGGVLAECDDWFVVLFDSESTRECVLTMIDEGWVVTEIHESDSIYMDIPHMMGR